MKTYHSNKTLLHLALHCANKLSTGTLIDCQHALVLKLIHFSCIGLMQRKLLDVVLNAIHPIRLQWSQSKVAEKGLTWATQLRGDIHTVHCMNSVKRCHHTRFMQGQGAAERGFIY